MALDSLTADQTLAVTLLAVVATGSALVVWDRLMALLTVVLGRLLGHNPMNTQRDSRLLMAYSILWGWATGAVRRATSWPKWLILMSYRRVAAAMSRRGYNPRPVSEFRRRLYPGGSPTSSVSSMLKWGVVGTGVVLGVLFWLGEVPRQWLVWYGAIVGGFALVGFAVALFAGIIIGTLEGSS